MDSGFSDGATGEESQEGFPGQEEDEDDEGDNLSTISGLSDVSGSDWKPTAGPFAWVRNHMMKGTDPRTILRQLIAADAVIPEDLDQLTMWKIILNMLSEPPKRKKLENVNTLQDVVELIKNSKRIVVLTGAGVSVSCGIPDFRSRDGVYARLAVDFPDLPDPQAMFDINYFRKDPRPFFKFAKEIYPGQFRPSPCHRFIKALERREKLLRNYTQNIDTLEQVAGIERIVQCHGSFATATCTKCHAKVDSDAIKADIFAQRIPFCKSCPEPSPEIKASLDRINDTSHNTASSSSSQTEEGNEIDPNGVPSTSLFTSEGVPGIMKPDIVFFGEGLGDEFHNSVSVDKDEVDLLIMIGSSLKVRPVALIPSSVPPGVPQVLINREPLSHLTPDVELLGDCDGIVNQLCHLLEWPNHAPALEETNELLPKEPEEQQQQQQISFELIEGESEEERKRREQELLASLWKPRLRLSKAKRLGEGKFYHEGETSNRYVFPGAEVYSDNEDGADDDDEDSSSDSSSSASDDEETTETNNENYDKQTEEKSPLVDDDNSTAAAATNSTTTPSTSNTSGSNVD